MHFFLRKPFALGVLTLLTLFTMVLLDSRTVPAYAATHHDTSVASQVTTNNHKGAMQAADTNDHGCPSGYACIYPQDAGWSDRPSQKWYNYGVYPLHNQFGNHYIYNNQTDEAWFWLCTDWNGNTCPQVIFAGDRLQVNLTPINSVRLSVES